MAETVVGMHPGDQTSEWSQFDFSQHEYPPPDSDFQFTSQLPQYPHHNYLDFSHDFRGVLYDRQGQALLSPSHANDLEIGDTENKTPLTQDQVAALESSFIAVPKPKTEHKKGLAERLGLDLRRVNNWFQNRRAKAKCQKHPGHQDSDSSSNGAPSSSTVQPFPSETHISSTPFFQEHLPYSAEPFSDNFTSTSTGDFDHFGNSTAGQANPIALHFDHTSNGDFSMEAQDGSTTNPAWLTDFRNNSTSEQFVIPTANHQTTISWSPQSLGGSHNFATGFDVEGKNSVNPSLMQGNVIGNGVLDNHSSQTLNSNTSSVGESNNLMTPPTNTPPLPWLSQEFDTRRASDSSELAHNVEGMHLQHGQWGLGLASTTTGPLTGSRVASAAGIATPETSPDQTAVKAFAPSSDIASRRKRHRPAALRSDTNPSFSYGGPMTASPHSRRSSASLAAPTQVRRIQSQGQNLNTQSFRVHKSATNSAQISPQNLQKYLEKQSLPQGLNRTAQGSTTPVTATAQDSPSKPSASAASASRSPAEYQHEFHISRPINNWNSTNVYNLPHANSSVPDLHSVSSQSHPGLSIQLPSSQFHSQPPSYHCPPQSAPPHQTAFFDDSPPTQNGPFPPPNWQGHQFTPFGSHSMGTHTPPMRQPVHFTQHNNSGYLPPFAPSYQFPQDGSPMSGFPGHNVFPTFPPSVLNGVPASPVELDIKVDVGPEPKLASRFEKFEFQHTFSDKYGQNGEKK